VAFADFGEKIGAGEGGEAGGVEEVFGGEGNTVERGARSGERGARASELGFGCFCGLLAPCSLLFAQLGGEAGFGGEPGDGGALLGDWQGGHALVDEARGGGGGEGLPVGEGHFL
jgi:hypothetical protein